MLQSGKVLGAIVEALGGDARVERVILFGSRARGDAAEESDFDVMVVEHDTADRIAEGRRLRDLLRKAGVSVDLVVVSREKFDYWRDTPGNVYFEAAAEGTVLYEAA